MDQLPPKPKKVPRRPKPQEPVAKPLPPKFKHDWYQTESFVTVDLFAKNVKPEDLEVDLQDKHIRLLLFRSTDDEFLLEMDLAYDIDSQRSSWRILSTKVELRLQKQSAIQWESLESTSSVSNKLVHKMALLEDAAEAPPEDKLNKPGSYWDHVATTVALEEKEEKLEGDAALNKLFQQIYADGNDELKRAMSKSFVESKGTVLSTNWEEVSKGKVLMKPPEGMEFRKFEKRCMGNTVCITDLHREYWEVLACSTNVGQVLTTLSKLQMCK